jgi:hypothetical protein
MHILMILEAYLHKFMYLIELKSLSVLITKLSLLREKRTNICFIFYSRKII